MAKRKKEPAEAGGFRFNPLAFRCGKCGAPPGVQCTNYRGKACAPHADRGADTVPVPRDEPLRVPKELRQRELWGEDDGL